MNVLVTGGTGYIGSHTVVELQQKGYDVFIIDNLSNSHMGVVDAIEAITGVKPHFSSIDLCNPASVKDFFVRNKIDSIIHFAALKAVGESVQQPLRYYHNNLTSLINLCQYAIEYGVKDFIFSSSCALYGEPDYVPVDEKHPIKKALSPYGATKQMCERILSDITVTGTMNVISLRYFNPSGAHPSVLIGELPLNEPLNLVPIITRTAAGKRKEIVVFGDDYDTPDGTCIRDYIHVQDIAVAHLNALERLTAKKNKERFEVFNLGTGRGYSVLEVIKSFEKVTGTKLNYRIGAKRPGDVTKVFSDCKLSNSVLGWKAGQPLEQMLLSAWEWEQKI